MKIKSLEITGLGKFKEQIAIDFSKPLTAIFGDPMEGKSTVLNAVKLLGMQRGYPSGLINKESEKAVIRLTLDNGYIQKEFRHSGVKVDAIIDNKKYTQRDISPLFNPFQLDQNHFKSMNAIARNQFLLDVFGVDTSELDSQYIEAEKEAKKYRKEVAEFGKIDTNPVDKPKTDELKAAKNAEGDRLTKLYNEAKERNDILRKNWETECDVANEKHLAEIQKYNEANNRIKAAKESVMNLQLRIDTLLKDTNLERFYDFESADDYINNMAEGAEAKLLKPLTPEELPKEPTYEPETFDKTEYNRISEELSNEAKNELLYEQYLERLELQKQKDIIHGKQLVAEKQQRDIKKQKAALLSKFSGKIKGLEFDEDGNAIFENTTIDMLSDSMTDRLSAELSALYTNSIPITLIDGGEKYGRFAVPHYLNYAKEHNVDVLMSVVGERPAEVNGDATIYVVESGQLS